MCVCVCVCVCERVGELASALCIAHSQLCSSLPLTKNRHNVKDRQTHTHTVSLSLSLSVSLCLSLCPPHLSFTHRAHGFASLAGKGRKEGSGGKEKKAHTKDTRATAGKNSQRAPHKIVAPFSCSTCFRAFPPKRKVTLFVFSSSSHKMSKTMTLMMAVAALLLLLACASVSFGSPQCDYMTWSSFSPCTVANNECVRTRTRQPVPSHAANCSAEADTQSCSTSDCAGARCGLPVTAWFSRNISFCVSERCLLPRPWSISGLCILTTRCTALRYALRHAL